MRKIQSTNVIIRSLKSTHRIDMACRTEMGTKEGTNSSALTIESTAV